jgi:hypothetical protein
MFASGINHTTGSNTTHVPVVTCGIKSSASADLTEAEIEVTATTVDAPL